MPKDTFFRLPDDKRNRILKGAKKEFYNCSFSEASINRIIKDAEIPRGSFYQYFEDKKDLYLYVIEENIKSVISNFGNKLEQSEGDIFLCVDNFISELLDETTKKALSQSERTIFLSNFTISSWLSIFKSYRIPTCGIRSPVPRFLFYGWEHHLHACKNDGTMEHSYNIRVL